MPFDVDSDKVIIEMPVYKPSTEIAFMSELMNKKELTREEKLQLFTVQTLDQIKFNLDNTVLIAMRAHNDIVKLRADVRALQAESDTPEDNKVKKFWRDHMGTASIIKYLILTIVSILLTRYFSGGGK